MTDGSQSLQDYVDLLYVDYLSLVTNFLLRQFVIRLISFKKINENKLSIGYWVAILSITKIHFYYMAMHVLLYTVVYNI